MTPDESKHSSIEGLANIQLLFKEIADSFAKQFPRFTEDSFKLLAKGGWYGHDDMPVTLIENTTMDIENDDYKSADSKMVEFFESTYVEDVLMC